MAYKNKKDAIKWRLKNKEKIKIKNFEYYLNNKDRISKRNKQYREEHKEDIKKINKNYYEENKEIIREKSKVYRDKNKDNIKFINKEYYKNNKDIINAKNKEYCKNNPEVIRRSYNNYRKSKPWMRFYLRAKSVCDNKNVAGYKYYGDMGIKCLITKEDAKFLWFRDKAYDLERSALARKDRDKDYTIENCKFIELIELMNSLDNKGINHPNYIDGRSPLNIRIRGLSKYKNWRKEILERDNYTCQECGNSDDSIEVHHINSFSMLLNSFLKEYDNFSPSEEIDILVRLSTKYEPFWNLENGKTLCKDCHMETGSYGPNTKILETKNTITQIKNQEINNE
jgi:5-methylcytosine-specific restriction endonuclease McrA